MWNAKVLCKMSLLAGMLIQATGVCLASPQNPNTNFLTGKYGLMIAYSDSAHTQDNGGINITQWNANVNSFNVPNFVAQVQSTGAAFVVIYLGQNNGYFLGPNSTYESAAKVGSGNRVSSRDLVTEIATALRAVGIKTMLYLPSGAPKNDTPAANAMGFTSANSTSGDWLINTTNAGVWSSIIKDWATRYGTLISGWWFDGYYDVSGLKDNTEAQMYANAAFAGNPNAVFTFDPWEGVLANNLAVPTEDFTAGDASQYSAPSSRWYNNNSNLEQWNSTFSVNGFSSWGLDIDNSQTVGLGTANSTSELVGYLQNVVAGGGSSMMDAKVDWTGFFAPQVYNQLLAVNAALNAPPNAGLVAGQSYVLSANSGGMALTQSSSGTVIQTPLTYSTAQEWTLLPGTVAGKYELKNVSSGLALNISDASTSSGGQAITWPYQNGSGTNDQWQLNSVGGISYQIVNVNSGLTLSMPSGSTTSNQQADQEAYSSSNLYQQFTLTPVPGTLVAGQTYEITVGHNGDAITANSTSQGAPVVQQPWTGTSSQLWKVLNSNTSGYYEIQNVASGLALNISGASTSNDGPAILWPYQNGSGTNDQWQIQPTGSGNLFQVINHNSGLSLEMPGANLTNGTQFDQWDYNANNAHQHFTFTAR